MPKFVGSSFVVLSLLSCQGKKPAGHAFSKDSVVNKYLHLLDSSDNADSNELKYKMLKGYINDDSSFFTDLDRNLEVYKQEREAERLADSCLHIGRLSEQAYEEAYRFYWTGSFCYHKLAITVGKHKKGIRLDFIEYQSSADLSMPCIVTRHAGKTLSEAAWQHLKATIGFAYFWSMEPHEDDAGTDGSDWKVEGFLAGPLHESGHFHSVYRHSPGVRAFSAIGLEMVKLSGQATHCFY